MFHRAADCVPTGGAGLLQKEYCEGAETAITGFPHVILVPSSQNSCLSGSDMGLLQGIFFIIINSNYCLKTGSSP